MRVLILILIASPGMADGLADRLVDGRNPLLGQQSVTPKAVDCYCTDTTRQRLEIGDTTCLVVGGKPFTAQCQMSLNVPMWRKISDGCQTSGLVEGSQPAG